MTRTSAVVCLCALLAPSLAGAECREANVRNAVSARVRADQVDALVRDAVRLLPTSIDLPATPVPVLDCNFLGETVVTPRNARIDLNLQDTEVTLQGGAIGLRVRFDLEANADLDLQICDPLPNAVCPANLTGESLEVFALVRLSVEDCEPTVSIDRLDVGIPAANTDVALASCGLYDELITTLFGWFEDTIIETVQDQLSAAVIDLAPDMAETAISSVVDEGIEALGLRVYVEPESLTVGRQDVVLTLASGVEPLIPPSSCSPGGTPLLPAPSVAPEPSLAGGAAIAVSRDFTNYLIDVAWRQGWLCLNSRDFGLDLSSPL
ncbi:MAG: hypothetical protein AAF658_08195, partial [Myxococcota bacterium]